MQRRNTTKRNGVSRVGAVCLLTVLLFPGLAPSQEQENATSAVPGIPPGEDLDSRRGGGRPLERQSIQSPLTEPQRRDGKFHLVEATIEDIHDALRQRELTCTDLITLYFKRIKAYSGHCVKYDKDGDGVSPDYDFFMPSGKGVYLGVVSPIATAGKVNAIQSVNLRPTHYTALGFAPPHDPGPRSETDLIDADPNLPDALEVAAQLDQDFQPNRLRPLHCIPIVVKDQMETIDMRTTDGSLTQFANDRPPNDGALVAKLRAAGAIIIAKANMDEYAVGTHRSSYG
jgi:amidase